MYAEASPYSPVPAPDRARSLARLRRKIEASEQATAARAAEARQSIATEETIASEMAEYQRRHPWQFAA